MTWKGYTDKCKEHGGLYLGRLFNIPFIWGWGWIIMFAAISFGGGPLVALGVALSIVAHEYGHILTARRFKVETAYVKLWFLGGVAMMKAIPRTAKTEFWIALAGPLVSFVLAGLFFGLHALTGMENILTLAVINTTLGMFNLVPALPLDGGRIYRAALQWKLDDHLKATHLAVKLAKVSAVVFVIAGLVFIRPMLPVLALFIWKSTKQEVDRAEELARLDKMLTEFAGEFAYDDERRYASLCLIKQIEYANGAEAAELLNGHIAWLKERSEVKIASLTARPAPKRVRLSTNEEGYAAYLAAHHPEWASP